MRKESNWQKLFNLTRLFTKYRNEETDRSTREMLDAWNPEDVPESYRASRRQIEKGVQRVKTRLFEELEIHNPDIVTKEKPRRVLLPTYSYYVAATIALLIAIGIPLLNKGGAGKADSPELVAQTQIDRQFITQGTMKRITLADGSVVHLNMGTTLSLHKGKFNADTREVWLDEGEAFFEVSKDPNRPFIVHTPDGLNTRVLGTSFNIKAYRELHEQVVSVKTGRVQVSQENGHKVLLEPDHNASFNTQKGTLTAEVGNGTDAADWRNGRIVLKNAHISEVALRLKQYYQTDIINPHKVSPTAVVHFSFTTDMPLNDIVTVLADIYEVQYKIEDNQIIFM